MTRIVAVLLEEEHKKWKDFCKVEGKSSSEILRGFVRKSIESDMLFETEKKDDIGKLSEQINLKLSKKQVQKIQKRAQEEGYEKATKWIRSLVMGVLYKEPILTDEEMKSLGDSRNSLAAIGRNLNQITRAINIDFRESDKLKFDMIEALKKMIEKHKKQTALLVRKSTKRWER